MTTRKQALEKAAEMLNKAENVQSNVNPDAVSKYLSLGQLWMGLAHEMANDVTSLKSSA